MNVKSMSIKDYLEKNTKKQLTSIARFHKMPGYSSLNKKDLADALGDYLYSPELCLPFLSYLGQDELACLSQGETNDSFLVLRLGPAGYCFKTSSGSYIFPEDFPLEMIKDDHFIKEACKKSLLLDCLECAGYLYGAFPYDNLLEMYHKAGGEGVTLDELKAFLEEIPAPLAHFAMTDRLIVHKSLLEKNLYEKIRLIQAATPYYYPGKEEIRQLARYGFMRDSHVDKLMAYMEEGFHACEKDINFCLSIIQARFRQGGSIKDVLDHFEKHSNLTKNMDFDRNDPVFLSLLNEVFSHSRLLLCRGYTAPEKQTQILHPQKIYPNSPCPCGSGKKYKKCCARLK